MWFYIGTFHKMNPSDFKLEISRFRHWLSKRTVLLYFAEYKTRWFTAILHMLKWFAGHQIRNVGVSVV